MTSSFGQARSRYRDDGRDGDDQRRESLQPYLLDRLCPQDPEAVDTRGGFSTMRTRVARDLEWLLNERLSDEHSFIGYDLVEKSVLRLGIEDLTSGSARRLHAPAAARRLEQTITEAIRTFEPRLIASTVRVRLLRGEELLDARMGDVESVESEALLTSTGEAVLEIAAEMFNHDGNEPFVVRTKLNLQRGNCEIIDRGRRPG